MGFPKLFEDNNRIRDDRLFMRGTTENCCIRNNEIYKKNYEYKELHPLEENRKTRKIL